MTSQLTDLVHPRQIQLRNALTNISYDFSNMLQLRHQTGRAGGLMTELPRDRLDADRFYRTWKAYTIGAENGAEDPWSRIPWQVEQRHADIVAKLIANCPEDQEEVRAYLAECRRLTASPQPSAELLQFPMRSSSQ